MTPVITIGLAVQNTSNQQFTLNSIAGDVSAKELPNKTVKVGNFSNFTPQTILPNSQSVIELKCRMNLLGIVDDILNSIETGSIKQQISLKGTANVDKLQIPITEDYKIG